MLNVATCLWDANESSFSFSTCYDETWVEKLYRGFQRNLSCEFRFVVFTDRERDFAEQIDQERLSVSPPNYGCMIEPFILDEPSIIVGLDTIVTGCVDDLADYCMSGKRIALPRDPYEQQRSINGVALVPVGNGHIYDGWHGENDMEYLRQYGCEFIDELFPGQVVSLKAHDVRRVGLRNARIVYTHGRPKPQELTYLDWVAANWR